VERIASIIRVKRVSKLVTANVVPSSPILFTLMMAIRTFETSIFTKATRRHIPEDGILHSHRREDIKSYIALT
jgi:hypothetical protein